VLFFYGGDLLNVRDLVFGIAWKINDNPLRRADKRTDEFKRSVGDLENEMGSVGSEGKRSFDKIERSVNEVDGSIRSIQDPTISGGQPVRALDNIEQEADQLGSTIRGIPDPHIDGSQARDELQRTEDEADKLSDKLGNIGGMIGGAIGGSVVGSDIVSFTQIPRELEANLGVTEKIANGLAKEVESVWQNVRGITKEQATESVETANRVFDVTGDKAGELGYKIALLENRTGENFHNIGLAAKNMVERFPDIKSEAEAFEMLYDSSTRLGKDGFSELVDQTQEYGSVISNIMSGQDFFGSMITAGEENFRVMDKFGDMISTELVPRIQEGEKEMISALTSVAANAKGIEGVTPKSYEEFQDLREEIQKLKEEGEKVPDKLAVKFANKKEDLTPAINLVERWRSSIVKGGEDGREATKELLGAFSELEGKSRKVAGIQIFKTMYEEQGPALDKIINKQKQGFQEVGKNVEKIESVNEGTLNNFNKKVKEGRTMLGGFGDALGGIGGFISGNLGAIALFAGSGGIGRIGKAAKGAGRGIKWLSNKFDGFGRTAWNTGKTVMRNAGNMGRTIGKFAGSAGKWLGKAGGFILRFGGKILGAAGKVAKFGWRIGKLFTPIGWLITLATDVGHTIVTNWDKITSASGDAETALGGFFKGLWMTGKLYINKLIGRVNWLIEKINLIPKVDIPNIGKLDTMTTDSAQESGLSPMAARFDGSHANGLARVPFDNYAPLLHKDESVFTAEQSNAMRNIGMLKDNGSRPELNLDVAKPEAAEVTVSQNSNPQLPPITIYNDVTISGENSIPDKQRLKREYKQMIDESIEEYFASISRVMPRVTEG